MAADSPHFRVADSSFAVPAAGDVEMLKEKKEEGAEGAATPGKGAAAAGKGAAPAAKGDVKAAAPAAGDKKADAKPAEKKK